MRRIVYVPLFLRPKCCGEIKVITVVEDPNEIKRILRYPGCRADQQPEAATWLVKIRWSPSGFDADSFN